MGRTAPSVGLPPASQRRDVRAKRAKQTANKDIPILLQAYPRAKKGVEASELIIDPPAATTTTPTSNHTASQRLLTTSMIPDSTGDPQQNEALVPNIRVQCADTLQAAAQFYSEIKAQRSKSPCKIAILNMASPLRPGGGFFTGATSQEESLCMRTTLYPALREEFYRLPEVGGIYTPDVLVFRSHNSETSDMPKNERFYVDVISSGMLRLPEVAEGLDGEKHYVEDKDKEMVERKMRAVLRMAKCKKVNKLVFGAWGCGAYGNPVGEVATLWRKVLSGGSTPTGKRKGSLSISETWESLEIVFAIKDSKMATVFARELDLEIEGDLTSAEDNADASDTEDTSLKDEKAAKIAQLEEQISKARSEYLRQGLQTVLSNLKESTEQ